MADEESSPDFGLTKSSSRTAERINSRGLDEATRLRRHAVASALDEVLKALDRDRALLENKFQLAYQPGLLLTLNAVEVARVYVDAVGLKEDANLLSVEGKRYNRVFTDHFFSCATAGQSEDEFRVLKQLYGDFPTRPTKPEEVDRFILVQEEKYRHHSDVVRRHVNRIQGLLTKGFAADMAAGSEELAEKSKTAGPEKVEELERTTPALDRDTLQSYTHGSLSDFQQFLDRLNESVNDRQKLNWLRGMVIAELDRCATKDEGGNFPQPPWRWPPRQTNQTHVLECSGTLAAVHDVHFRGQRIIPLPEKLGDKLGESFGVDHTMLSQWKWHLYLERIKKHPAAECLVELLAMLRTIDSAWGELSNESGGVDRIANEEEDRKGVGGANGFEQLVEWAANELKGKQRKVIELLAEAGGSWPISSLAEDSTIAWDSPHTDAWNSIRRELNNKLKKAPERWYLTTHDGQAILSKIGQK